MKIFVSFVQTNLKFPSDCNNFTSRNGLRNYLFETMCQVGSGDDKKDINNQYPGQDNITIYYIISSCSFPWSWLFQAFDIVLGDEALSLWICLDGIKNFSDWDQVKYNEVLWNLSLRAFRRRGGGEKKWKKNICILQWIKGAKIFALYRFSRLLPGYTQLNLYLVWNWTSSILVYHHREESLKNPCYSVQYIRKNFII